VRTLAAAAMCCNIVRREPTINSSCRRDGLALAIYRP
jgi:hypothetical protein